MSNFLTGHRFYSKTNREKRVFFAKLLLISTGVIVVLGLLSYFTHFYFIGIIGFSIYLTLLAPFIDVPGLQKTGGLVYYSPLFLGEKPKNNKITIHGGTLFDYLFVLDYNSTGRQRTQFIFQQFLIGLLHLVEELENQNLRIEKITGTSYFLNEKTASRIGFQKIKTNSLQQMILAFNYFNLMFTQSKKKKKVSFPKLSETQSFETTPKMLISKKEDIEILLKKIS